MAKLTPQRIAEDAIRMFIERMHALSPYGIDSLGDDVAEQAIAQAVAECEGYEVILPHEQQRLEAVDELLAVCNEVSHGEDIAQGFGGLYAWRQKLRNMAREAIVKATVFPATQPGPLAAEPPGEPLAF